MIIHEDIISFFRRRGVSNAGLYRTCAVFNRSLSSPKDVSIHVFQVVFVSFKLAPAEGSFFSSNVLIGMRKTGSKGAISINVCGWQS